MEVVSVLGQKSGKGKGKRDQEESQETARMDFLQGRRDQRRQEVLGWVRGNQRGGRNLTTMALPPGKALRAFKY